MNFKIVKEICRKLISQHPGLGKGLRARNDICQAVDPIGWRLHLQSLAQRGRKVVAIMRENVILIRPPPQ